MSNERAHALVLAETLMNISNGRSPQSESFNAAAATELQTQHFRIKELEAMLDAVGAGGVSAQCITHGKDHIAQPPEIVAAPVVLPEPGINTASHAGFRVIGYTEQQVRELLDKAACTKSQTTVQEPFGYFKAEPFGWRDCAETDEGAVALYEAPQPQADARAAERVDALYKALDVCSAELFAQCAHQGRAMKYVEQARKALAAEQCARAAVAAEKEI